MSSRFVYVVSLILALTAAYACWCRAPMIWDGAYQFNSSLIMQRPYFYLTRFHTFFLWMPTVWASRFTDNIALLQTIYGLPFLLAPLLAVVLSWWMVRTDAPHLIIWPIFGVAAGSLPGQIFVINDSIFQQHLFWPIFMGLFVPLSKPKKIAIGILAVFQFVHPLGVILFFGATLAALIVSIADRENRRRRLSRAGVMALLFGLTASKIIITNHIPALYDDYAAQEAKWSTAIDRWGVGVRGWPLHGLWFMWSAAAMLLLWTRARRRLSMPIVASLTFALAIALAGMGWKYRFDWTQGLFGAAACLLFYIFVLQFRRQDGPGAAWSALPVACVIIAAVCWIHWASDGRLWWKAIDYRRWVGPMTAPFFLLAMLDASIDAMRRNPSAKAASSLRGFPVAPLSGDEKSTPMAVISPLTGDELFASRAPLRGPLALLLAVTFATVLGLQCTVWHVESIRLMSEVRDYPATIVPESTLPWTDGTPLDHWAISDYVMAMQGKTPSKLLLDPRGTEHIYENPPKIPHWDFYPHARVDHPDPTPGPAGWFDLRPLLAKLKSEPRPKNVGPERLDAKTTPE